jgi:putative glutathione S-transferase
METGPKILRFIRPFTLSFRFFSQQSYQTSISKVTGQFERRPSKFRSWISRAPNAEFPPEKDRYHLYVSAACPWAHRTLIMRKFKALTSVISVTVVHHFLGEKGWKFDESRPDPIFGKTYLREIYQEMEPGYSESVTVPVLFDKKAKKIVNNESSEIIRMLNSEFNDFCETEEAKALDFYPEDLREVIDSVNPWVYQYINNGVYRSGFASTQEAYDSNVKLLFEHLEKAEQILEKSRYLAGNRLTEADIRLFTTLVRFDPVYYGHFKCNIRPLSHFHNLWNFTKELYQMKEIKGTVDFFHIKHHYYESHRKINPYGIVPQGPIIDWDAPHDRNRFEKTEIQNASSS